MFCGVCSRIPAKARVDEQSSVWSHSIGAMGKGLGGMFGGVCVLPAKARVDEQNSVWGHVNGAMDEVSGKGQKASTHGGSVGVDLAAGERDCAAAHGEATSVLPNTGGT